MKIDSKLEHCRQFKPVFENHTKEFVKLWKSGQEATLNINCKNGRAWINLSTYLGYYGSDLKDETFITPSNFTLECQEDGLWEYVDFARCISIN